MRLTKEQRNEMRNDIEWGKKWPLSEVVHNRIEGYIGPLLDYADTVDREIEKEKKRRIYYQDLVYHACNIIDSILGGQRTTTGILETPDRDFEKRLNQVKVLAKNPECDILRGELAVLRKALTSAEECRHLKINLCDTCRPLLKAALASDAGKSEAAVIAAAVEETRAEEEVAKMQKKANDYPNNSYEPERINSLRALMEAEAAENARRKRRRQAVAALRKTKKEPSDA